MPIARDIRHDLPAGIVDGRHAASDGIADRPAETPLNYSYPLLVPLVPLPMIVPATKELGRSSGRHQRAHDTL